MGYTVVFHEMPESLSSEVKERVRLLLDEMGETASSIPREDPFWVYTKESGITLDCSGWRFTCRIDRGARQLIVYHCEPLLDSASQ